MKKKLLRISLVATFAAFIFSSCSDNENVEPWVEPEFNTTGAFILNEGLYLQSNSKLSYYNIEQKVVTGDIFENRNPGEGVGEFPGLGDTANDGIIYGSKMYIAVDQSNTIWVTDLTGKLIADKGEISTTNNEELKDWVSPRHLASHNGYVYVDFYSGHIAKIDTVTLQVVGKLAIPAYSEQMAVVASKNEMYVANPGGGTGKTVTVVDLNTFTVKGEPIVVGLNPQKIAADKLGNLYVVSSGNYVHIKDELSIISSDTKKVTKVIPEIATYIAVQDNKLLMVRHQFDATIEGGGGYHLKYSQYNIHTQVLSDESFIKIPEEHKADLTNPFSISIDPQRGDIYIGNSEYVSDGKMFVFSKSGDFKDSFSSMGKGPNKAIFVEEQTN